MQDDKPLIAVLIGAISTIPYEIFTRILLALGIGKYSVYELSSLTVTLNRPNALLGFVSSSLIGGITTLVFYYTLRRISKDYLIIKALFTGLFCWIFTEAFYTISIEGPKLITMRPISDYYMQLIGSAIFGITVGILFKKYLVTDRISK